MKHFCENILLTNIIQTERPTILVRLKEKSVVVPAAVNGLEVAHLESNDGDKENFVKGGKQVEVAHSLLDSENNTDDIENACDRLY